MINITSKIINGPYGSIKPITFKNFLSLIRIKVHPDRTSNLLISKGVLLPRLSIHNTPQLYDKETLFLCYDEILPSDFLECVDIQEHTYTSLLETADNMLRLSLYNGGSPTHLVLIAPRLWMCANPASFLIHKSDVGMNVACNFPKVSICWSIERGKL